MTSVQGDHNTQLIPSHLRTNCCFLHREPFFGGLVEVCFSYKTSSKSGIMKNRCIPQTLSASLEIKEKKKKKKKFNKAVAESKRTLPIKIELTCTEEAGSK